VPATASQVVCQAPPLARYWRPCDSPAGPVKAAVRQGGQAGEGVQHVAGVPAARYVRGRYVVLDRILACAVILGVSGRQLQATFSQGRPVTVC
jgi:hypothetical protein